jgi:hypothetical protein
MKTTFLLTLAFSLVANLSIAQNKHFDQYFKIKPRDIKVLNAEIQKYDVTLKWQNLDAINGNKINCNAVTATYIVGLENGYVGWKNVSLAQIDDFNQTQYKGTDLPSFNKLTYNAIDTAFLSEKFYTNIPIEQRDLAKWLVSDAVQMQGLAWYVFDSLEFKTDYFPKLLENHNVRFEDWVTFTSRYQKLVWSGITKHNDEICAIVKFESFYNPVKIDNVQMQVKGRSLYYGEMWISLTDKQVEYAVMFEDVVMKLTSTMFPDEQLIDLQREIVFSKQK